MQNTIKKSIIAVFNHDAKVFHVRAETDPYGRDSLGHWARYVEQKLRSNKDYNFGPANAKNRYILRNYRMLKQEVLMDVEADQKNIRGSNIEPILKGLRAMYKEMGYTDIQNVAAPDCTVPQA